LDAGNQTSQRPAAKKKKKKKKVKAPAADDETSLQIEETRLN